MTNISLNQVKADYNVRSDSQNRARVPTFAAALIGLHPRQNAFVCKNKNGMVISNTWMKGCRVYKVERDGSVRFRLGRFGFQCGGKRHKFILLATSGGKASLIVK